MRIVVSIIVCFFIHLQVNGQTWVDQKIDSMTIEEKVGQLFMIRAHSDLGKDHIDQVKKYIKDYKVGSLCFFQGTPKKQSELTNDYQALSDIPLMVAMDAEWGLAMRFPKDVISFPRPLMLGAIQNDNMIYQIGQAIGNQLKRIGVHVNFGPVIDVNNNQDNPVINDRSFGEDVYKVSAKGYNYVRGMQDVGVLGCAKHFPGHGDTDVDSHYDLPVISHDRRRLDSIELRPFQMLAQQNVASMMVAHVHMPALDNRPNRPTTLSKAVVTDLLQDELGFRGIIFTDAMEMKGVSKHFPNGTAEVEAFLAGNDVLVLPNDLPVSYQAILQAVKTNKISIERLNKSVRKILAAKYKLNIHKEASKILDPENALQDINTQKAKNLKRDVIQDALTLVKNEGNIVPIVKSKYPKIGCLSLGENTTTEFQKTALALSNCKNISANKVVTKAERKRIILALRDQDIVLVSLHDMSKYSSKAFGVTNSSIELIQAIAKEKKVVLTIFGSPYALRYFEDIPNVLIAYNEDEMTQLAAAEALFGVNDIRGRLPVGAGSTFKVGDGYDTHGIGRLGIATPEEVGMSSDTLKKIDKIIEEMIKTKAAPGCQILVAKDNKVVFHKAYGYHTYDKKIKVKKDDVYDLASVTKILATTISLMKLQDDKQFSIYNPLKSYLPEIDTSNKADLISRDVLAHHSGMPGWIPFYKNTVDRVKKKTVQLKEYYRSTVSDSFSLKVSDDLFLRTDYQDSIYSRILGCKLRTKRDYRYSDLGFYLFDEIVHRLTGMSLHDYTKESFYSPLGLTNTTFNPLDKIDPSRIPPSEKDTYFRNCTVQGYVHDMGAAMCNGVSGHAGLFSNSYELAILMQMLLNGGAYGGRQYIEPKTVRTFTNRYFRSTRRGLGFDMKELNEDKKKNMSEKAPSTTFGHLGFTGTAAFADPENNIIYIFLSNRTYPSMNNNKFSRKEYRPRVQTVIYNALQKNRA